MVEEFRARRELVVDGPERASRRLVPRRRAARSTPSRTSPSVPLAADELADRLLEEAGVAVLAGSAFGRFGTDNLRLSYANSRENLALALERMRDFLERL